MMKYMPVWQKGVLKIIILKSYSGKIERYDTKKVPIIFSLTSRSCNLFDIILKAGNQEIAVLKILRGVDYLAILILNMFTLFIQRKLCYVKYF